MASKNEVDNKLLTIMLIFRNNQVLLGMKKRGFGVNRWNGFGGKVHDGESIVEAAKRETLEECCVEVINPEHVGKIIFEFTGDAQLLEVHVFTTDVFTGTPTETEEMLPKWFDIDEIPYQNMWPDDIDWYPYILQKKKFEAYFLFEGHDTVLKKEIKEISQS
eukprot:gene8821-9766_t